MFSPTPRQLDLLRFIAGYQAAHDGRSPSFVECRIGIGVVSKSNLTRMMAGLESRGLIRRHPARGRATRPIELLMLPAIPTAPDGAPLHAVFLSDERLQA